MAKDYFTGAQVHVVVNGYVVDEAHGIDYQTDDSHVPLYGCRSRVYSAVATGRTVVYGTMWVHFVYRGYLMQAIAMAKDAPPAEGETVQELIQRLSDEKNQFLGDRDGTRRLPITEEGWHEFLTGPIESGDLNEYEKRKIAQKDLFWGSDGGKKPGESPEDFYANKGKTKALMKELRAPNKDKGTSYGAPVVLARPSLLTEGFDMQLIYGTMAADPRYVKTIKDVHFVGESQIVRASVEGSDEPLMEQYRFLAKTIV